MAIGGKQKPLHELTALLGAQPAAYRGEHWGERERGQGESRLRADRALAGLHPVGIAPVDAAKTSAGHGCKDCVFRVANTSGTRFSACALAMQTIDRRKTYGGKRAHQVRLQDPACTKHESLTKEAMPDESATTPD